MQEVSRILGAVVMRTPTAFPKIAQGCAYSRYPGEWEGPPHQPQRGCLSEGIFWATPLGLMMWRVPLSPGEAWVHATPGLFWVTPLA